MLSVFSQAESVREGCEVSERDIAMLLCCANRNKKNEITNAIIADPKLSAYASSTEP